MNSDVELRINSKPARRSLKELLALAEYRPVRTAESEHKTPLRQYLDAVNKRPRRKGRWTQIPGVEGAEYKSPNEMEFARQCDLEGIIYEREQKLVPGRKFRADFTFEGDKIKDRKIALEVQGGTGWGQIRAGRSSAHKSPAGLLRDYEKGFLAQLYGWMVIQVTGQMVWDGSAMTWLKIALGRKQ